jgi:hypothetical protein
MFFWLINLHIGAFRLYFDTCYMTFSFWFIWHFDTFRFHNCHFWNLQSIIWFFLDNFNFCFVQFLFTAFCLVPVCNIEDCCLQSYVAILRASPPVLSMWLQTVKFIVKMSKCAGLAQEIGPNSCSLLWLVKGATHVEMLSFLSCL